MLFSFPVRYGLVVFLLLLSMRAGAVVAVPELSRPVTDLTSTLNAGQIAALENKLTAFEVEKNSQIAVLIVSTTQPKDIAEYSLEVADLWQISHKGGDNVVILIVAKDDKEMHLEVGYDPEDVISGAVAKRVITETISPYIKAGDFVGGIDAGVVQLMKLIGGESLAEMSDSLKNDKIFIFMLFGSLFIGFALFILIVV